MYIHTLYLYFILLNKRSDYFKYYSVLNCKVALTVYCWGDTQSYFWRI